MNEYIADKIKEDIVKEIEGLEFPPEWRPKDVLNYIIKIIRKGI